MIFKIINGKAVRYDSGGTEKIDDSTVDFSQAESRENIAPTDTMKTILGKIMKWFSDLSAGAASSLLGQNLTAGKVLVSDDGGKVAASVVDASKVGFLSGVTGDVQGQINDINHTMEQYKNFIKLNSEQELKVVLNSYETNTTISVFCVPEVTSILTKGKYSMTSRGLMVKPGNYLDFTLALGNGEMFTSRYINSGTEYAFRFVGQQVT